MKCYPVIIPTLNRYEHFRRCIESLSRCTHAEKTEVVVGLDYPPSEKYVEGYDKIKNYLHEISGFSNVKVLYSEINLGPDQNLKRLRDYVENEGYDAFISSEDDNEFSPSFLDYMNKALCKYRDNREVIAICGYSYPIGNVDYHKNTFASQNLSAWGLGRWIEKVSFPNDYQSYCKKILSTKELRRKIHKKDPRMIYSLINSASTGCMYGDRMWTLKCLIEDKYCIYPVKSLVRNWGNDGTGLHSGNLTDDIFRRQDISTDTYFAIDDIDLGENPVNEEVLKFLNRSNLKSLLRRFVYTSKDLLRLMFMH